MLDLFSMDSEVKLFLIKIKVEAGISFSIYLILDKFLIAEYNQSNRALESFERGIKLDVGLLNLLLVPLCSAELFVKFVVERQAQKDRLPLRVCSLFSNFRWSQRIIVLFLPFSNKIFQVRPTFSN